MSAESSESDTGTVTATGHVESVPETCENKEKSSNSESDKMTTADSKKPVGVSEAAWQKFQQLKEKRLALSQKSSKTKSSKPTKATPYSLDKMSEPGSSATEDGKSTPNKTEDKEWQEVRNYLGAFDHLEAACVEQHQEKSGLEKKLEKAIAEGNINEADHLSDQLANRQFGAKIANAFDAQKFTKRQKEREEELKAKKKRKLNWQFEHKEKWEMKANM